ncbi:heme o synthase [Compostibacter hankyongensis]|uniref:Protoheme IX farnesyltransferase n=1 Tax=Compostibacter hankyongensis TaxID=1007089 RepID=A0ABP8FDV0_9BACT
MIQENSIKLPWHYAIACKVKDYFQLTKFTLSFMVVFSSVIGYLLVPGVGFDLLKVLLLFAGGLLITGCANAINQIMERDTDALMKRTARRPLPDKRMKVEEAAVFAAILGIGGLVLLALVFNWQCAFLSLLSIVLYGFVYTPWKKWNSLAVLVGAIPGALPPLIGWVAGSGQADAGGWILFAMQFLWQFPHFWAIGWVAYDDYKRAGFKLLPSDEGKNRFTALQSVTYTIMLIPVGWLPYYFHLTGIVSAVIVMGLTLFFVFRAVQLYRFCDVPHARKLMFGSYIYLTVAQLVLLADKVKVV